MRTVRTLIGVLLVGAWACLPLRAQVSPGQVDDFENGTTQGWAVGSPHPAAPANVASGGPAGADDNYMLLTAIGGGGPGSRLAAFNTSRWSGDYSGIPAIAMDLNNFGATSLAMRLAIANPLGGPPEDVAVTEPVMVGAGSGWIRAVFPLGAGHLTADTGDVDAALRSATELRLFHNPSAAYPGPAVVASLGVDNITAIRLTPAVPEPASAALLAVGLAPLLLRRRRA